MMSSVESATQQAHSYDLSTGMSPNGMSDTGIIFRFSFPLIPLTAIKTDFSRANLTLVRI